MKKLLVIWVAIFVIGFAILAFVNKKDIVIKAFSANVDIQSNGAIDFTETTLIEYNGDYHGRFRDIAYGKNHANNPLTQMLDYYKDKTKLIINGVTVKANGVDVTKRVDIKYSTNGDTYTHNGIRQPVECVAEGECESIYVEAENLGGMAEVMEFTYFYTIEGAVTQYNDISELNWVLFSGLEEKTEYAEVIVTLPGSALKEDDVRAWGHGLSTGSIMIDNRQVIYSAHNVKTTEEFEIRTIFPNESVPDINERNIIAYNRYDAIVKYEAELAAHTNFLIWLSLAINFVTIVIIILTVIVVIILYRKYDKEYKPQFEGEYYRELPYDYTPAEMSYLYYFKNINDEDVTATLLDLIRRGFVEVDTGAESVNEKDPDFTFALTAKDRNELLAHEKCLVTWFFETIGDGKKVSIKEIETYGKSSYANANTFEKMGKRFKDAVNREASKYDFFETISKGFAKGYGFLLVVVTLIVIFGSYLLNIDAVYNIVALVIASLGYIVYVASIKRRSVNGNEQYAKWRAFKKFLTDFSQMKDYPIPGVAVWEEYLAYATSLKIADKVMEQLEVKLPQSEFESTEATFMCSRYHHSFARGYMFGRITNTMTVARMNVTSTIASHNAASGGGRGGGFSGGSSFGGGGGGGRSI